VVTLAFEIAERARARYLADDLAEAAEAASAVASQADITAADTLALQSISCRVGCSFCCHMRVVATVPEVAALVAFVRDTYSQSQLAALRDRVIAVDDMTRGFSDEDWGVARPPCPLLVNDACSVYGARPLDCRAYNSTSVEACRAAFENYLEWDVPSNERLRSVYKSAQAGLIQGMVATDHRPRLVELTAALRIALDDPTAFDRWIAGENSFAAAELDEADPEQRAFLPWVPSDELRAAQEVLGEP
jgi:Fe-S-cluster containining protein